ncbi:MAG: LytTR family transcriptional regulator [Paludibacteraceae bacterium]|nr:LytTR family transcriptional regulator [Paludibacteraceae bacterium]
MAESPKISPIFTRIKCLLYYVIGIPAFFLIFTTLYRPMRVYDLFNMVAVKPDGLFSFNVTIVSCILLGVMAISRTLMAITYHRSRMTRMSWWLWQVAELVGMSLFVSLYLTLMYKGQYTYYGMAGISMGVLVMTLVYPYTILYLIWSAMAAKEEAPVEDDSLMRFRDQQKQVKLIIASAAVLYIEAKDNYVIIKYKDGDIVKEYTLRSSMVALQELMHKHGLVRCQRSYYINPAHVKVLRKDKEGIITAELTTPNLKAIPVSPRYYDALANLL